MTPRSLLLLLPSLLLSSTVGCGYARIYSQNSEGGVLSIHGFQRPAMKRAGRMMDSHCGLGNHSLVSRDTVVVGQSTKTSSDTEYKEEGGSKTTDSPTSRSSETQDGKAGAISTEETTVSRDVTETRLTYACGG